MPDPKIFYKVNDAEYDTYQTWAADPARANIPDGGKVCQIMGYNEPDRQRVDYYSAKIPHETNPDDNICEFGDYPNPAFGFIEYTLTEAVSNGYISNDDPFEL
jgi:hypothetical protein